MKNVTKSNPVNEQIFSQNNTFRVDYLIFTLSETKKRILIHLALNPYQGYRKIAEYLGISINNIRSHLNSAKESRSLMDLGLVIRTSHGWSITPLGEECFQELQKKQKWVNFVNLQEKNFEV